MLNKFKVEYESQNNQVVQSLHDLDKLIESIEKIEDCNSEQTKCLLNMANAKLTDEKMNQEFNSAEFFDLAFMMPKHLSKFFLLEQSNCPVDPNL
jgi:hypothetical protein